MAANVTNVVNPDDRRARWARVHVEADRREPFGSVANAEAPPRARRLWPWSRL